MHGTVTNISFLISVWLGRFGCFGTKAMFYRVIKSNLSKRDDLTSNNREEKQQRKFMMDLFRNSHLAKGKYVCNSQAVY